MLSSNGSNSAGPDPRAWLVAGLGASYAALHTLVFALRFGSHFEIGRGAWLTLLTSATLGLTIAGQALLADERRKRRQARDWT